MGEKEMDNEEMDEEEVDKEEMGEKEMDKEEMDEEEMDKEEVDKEEMDEKYVETISQTFAIGKSSIAGNTLVAVNASETLATLALTATSIAGLVHRATPMAVAS